MPNVTISLPSLSGGVSRQAAALRHTNQVQEADNCLLTVRNGCAKRPGTRLVALIDNLQDGGDYRLHPIHRDENEKYLVICGESALRILDLAAVDQSVQMSDEALDYLAAESPTADELRLTTIADYTMLVNQLVIPLAVRSDPYEVAGEHRDYDVLASNTPEALSYHRTIGDTVTYPAGYWRYDPGDCTYATVGFPTTNTTWGQVSAYTNAANNPMGFRVFFIKLAKALSACSWTEGSKILTKASGFTDYTHTQGDQIYISGGTATTAGYYTIASKTDNDNIVLGLSPGASASDITTDGIGRGYNVEVNFEIETFADMCDVALAFQRTLRDLGATNACVSWTKVATNTGKMTITSPFGSSAATFADTTGKPVMAPEGGGVIDITNGGGEPFYVTGSSITAGTGTAPEAEQDVAERWDHQPPPNQAQAVLDGATMPIQIVRTSLGEDYPASGYAPVLLADDPFAYWRLGETTGSTADNAEGTAAYDGTYHYVILGGTGLLPDDPDKAPTFDDDTWVDCGALGTFGSQCRTQGWHFEAWIKTTYTSQRHIFQAIAASSSTNIQIALTSDGYLAASFSSNLNGQAEYSGGESTIALNDGDAHYVAVTFYPDSKMFRFFIDGYEVETTTTPTESGEEYTDWNDFVHTSIGSAVSGAGAHSSYFKGDLDEVALWLGTSASAAVNFRYRRALDADAATPALFVASAADWKPRYTGDQNSNPVPSIIEDGLPITDISFHRNRLVLAGGENLVFGQAGDEFNLFIEDADDLGDADPIDVPVSSNQVCMVDSVLPFRKALLILTKAGQQFELNAPEVLTYNTAAITPTTNYQTIVGCVAATSGSMAYLASNSAGYGQVLEYYYDDTQATNIAADVTAHAVGYLPPSLRRILAAPNRNLVIALPEDDHVFYTYRYFWVGLQKVQSAWARYILDASDRIADMALIGDDAYLLIENVTSGWSLQTLPLEEVEPPAGIDYDSLLDCRQTLTGVYDGEDELTTWDYGLEDATINAVVLGAGWGADAGTIVGDLTHPSSHEIAAAGDWSAHPCYVGRNYTMTLELSEPYVRGRDGETILDGTLQLARFSAIHGPAGHYVLRVEQPLRTAAERTFAPLEGFVEERGEHSILVIGPSHQTTVKIVNTTAFPSTIASGQFVGTFTPKAK